MPTFLVVGAGTTGIGAAVRLTELGIDHLVVDAGDRLGGMSASVTDRAGFTWDLGGHVLHSHFEEFDRAVEASGIRLNHVARNGWVWLRGDGPQSLLPTPIQQQLTELPTDLYPDAPVQHLADYYRNNFGRDLYDEFFEPYNRKMWTLPLHDIDHEWTSLRSGSAARNVPVLGLAGGAPAPASTFPYPVGGTGALWQAVHDKLMTPDSVRLRTRVLDIDPAARVAHLDDGSAVPYRYCISTAPVTTALGWIGWSERANTLRASRLHAVGLGYRGEPPPALADKTWLYCPAESVPWYRATMLSNYDAANAGPGRWNILCEVPVFAENPISAADAVDGVQRSLQRLGADPAQVVSRFSDTLDFGYPVPTLGRDRLLREADERLRAHGIYSRGRFGGWRYESSNQDYGYVQGRQAVDNALSGAPEDVYWYPERF
ncbi:FAD-dependent oxidoreductase [Mycobacterium sp. AMU20-3851]|uniref:protoporphyrinogen/coproporphyrinogen oxidase n=1 Tax=Mycobacterium sp. AMU20-3851 TaxID=3122055 RepID=UPI003754A053